MNAIGFCFRFFIIIMCLATENFRFVVIMQNPILFFPWSGLSGSAHSALDSAQAIRHGVDLVKAI